MVIIIKKVGPKRIDIILIPKRSLNDMLERHVDRTDLAQGRVNTCIVASGREWTDKPSHRKVIKLLMGSIKKERIQEGERRYPIPHHLVRNLKCRYFKMLRGPVSPAFEGNFVINFVKIKGKRKRAIAELQSYEKLGEFERLKIKNAFKKAEEEGKGKKIFVFLAHHIHPAKKKIF